MVPRVWLARTEIREMSAPKVHRASVAPKVSLAKKVIQAHRAHRVSRDPKEWLARREIRETLVNKALLVYKDLSGCMDRLDTQASKANKEWLAPQECKVPSVLQALKVFRARLVLIAVVLGVVVVRPILLGKGSR